MTHLGIITPFPPNYSGVGQYGWHMAHGLAATGGFHTITVLAEQAARPAPQHAAHPSNLHVERVWQRDNAASFTRLLRAIHAARPNVVWFNAGLTMFGQARPTNFLGLLTPWFLKRWRIPVVVTLHEVVETARLRALGLQNGSLTHWGAHTVTHLLLQSEAVCVTLRRYATVLREHYGARNVHHLPHGAFSSIAPLPRPPHAPPADILFFTSLAPHRGLAVLLEAFRRVHAALPHATLTIAGSDHPRYPGYGAQLQMATAGQSGVRWRGPLSETQLQTALAEARLVVLPYLATSGASSVLHRAAAAGRAVIASDLPDLRASAEDSGLQAAFVPPGQPEALARQLLDWLMHLNLAEAQAAHNLRAMQPLALEATSCRYAELLLQVARPT
jgi:glycosyltransferase involved in cell wall biosynthesis